MDENSIIITPQFYFYFEKTKTGVYDYIVYDFDLIVPKKISCDELLEAIKYGLENKLKSSSDIAVDEYVYDNRYCYDLVSDNSEEDKDKDSSKYTKEQMTQKYSSYKEDELFAICKYIFEKCYRIYFEQNFSIIESENKDLTVLPQKSFVFSPRKLFIGRKNDEDSSENTNISIDSINTIGISSVNPVAYKDGDSLSYAHNDQIWLNHYKHGDKELSAIGFISSTRIIFDAYSEHGGRFLFSEDDISDAFKGKIPEYNISDRPLYELDTEPVNIIPPTDPPKLGRQNLFAAFLSPLLMMGSMLVARLFINSGTELALKNTMIMSGTMLGATILMGFINLGIQRTSHKKAVDDWKNEYQNYIQLLIEEIKARQRSDILKLHELFPPVYEADYSDIRIGGLIEKTTHLNGDIFGRSRKHPNFLKVRLGTAERNSKLVPSVFEIKGEKKDVLFSTARYKNIGSGKGKHCFSILLDAEAKDTDGSLVDLPFDIARRYACLGDIYAEKEIFAPVILDIKKCGTLGIVRRKAEYDERNLVQALLDNIILDLCFHHNPGDLQICMFFNKTENWTERQNLVNKFKYLPHFRELLGSFTSANYKDDDEISEISQFVFDSGSAGHVFDRILEIVTLRKADEKAERYPHIVMVFIDDYHFKSHQLSEFLNDVQTPNESKNDFGLSFIFCSEHFESLPKYCGYIIEIGANSEQEESKLKVDGKCSMRLLPHFRNLENKKRYDNKGDVFYSYPEMSASGQYCLVSDVLSPTNDSADDKKRRDNYLRAFKILSSLYYFRIAQGAGVPNLVELINLHDSYKELIASAVEKSGTEYSATETDEDKEHRKIVICSDIIKSIPELVLNIKEKQKSTNDKLSITKSLAVPIGFKNEKEIVNLDLHEKHDGPHMLVAGTTGSGKSEAILTYLIGLCMCYTPEQVNLLLVDMKGGDFIRRIGSLPHVVGTVSDIDSVSDEEGVDGDNMEYMLSRFLRSMKAEIKRRKNLFKKLNVKDIDDYIKAQKKSSNKNNLPPLPHLFLVVDEFTELMQFTEDNPNIDFKKEISSLARIGRSLGFHIILISQNIEGAITDNIRVNSRARLCLKVATKEASKEMIGSDAAADPLMPGFGRGFLYVGNGSRSDYFQAAYSGASAITNSKQRILIPLVEKSGRYSVFYNSYLHNKDAISEKEKADNAGTQIEWLTAFVCELSKEFIKDSDDLPHKVLKPLLPSIIPSEKGERLV